jgi:hypothetical protein
VSKEEPPYASLPDLSDLQANSLYEYLWNSKDAPEHQLKPLILEMLRHTRDVRALRQVSRAIRVRDTLSLSAELVTALTEVEDILEKQKTNKDLSERLLRAGSPKNDDSAQALLLRIPGPGTPTDPAHLLRPHNPEEP